MNMEFIDPPSTNYEKLYETVPEIPDGQDLVSGIAVAEKEAIVVVRFRCNDDMSLLDLLINVLQAVKTLLVQAFTTKSDSDPHQPSAN